MATHMASRRPGLATARPFRRLAPPLYAILSGDAVVGALWFQGADLPLLDNLPDAEGLPPQILDATIEKARRAGTTRLSTEVADEDTGLQAALAAAGFSRSGPGSVRFERDLERSAASARR